MDQALNTVKEILDDLTPENIRLCTIAIGLCCRSAGILEEVTSLIYDNAVAKLESCPLYAQLCRSLSLSLPEFPAEDPNWKQICFKRLLLNCCQQAFEGAYKSTAQVMQMTVLNQVFHFKYKVGMAKRQALGNVCFIVELYKQRLVTETIVHRILQELLKHDLNVFPAEENLEAVCLILKTVGKQFDENPRSRDYSDAYYNSLKDLSTNPQLVPHLRVMVLKVIDLRANNWVSRHEGVKDHTITGNNPGAFACSSNSRCRLSVAQENTEAAPPIDKYEFKVKTYLEEYFIARHLEETMQCIVELKSPSYHPEIIKEAISMGLKKDPPCNEPVSNLLEYLLAKNVITLNDIAGGLVSYGSIIDDVSIDLPKAPHSFGEIMGRLVFACGLKFDVVGEVLKKSEYFKMEMLKTTLNIVSNSLADVVL